MLSGPAKEHWYKARYPSGKGEVCKTFMRRFASDPRLQILQSLETFATKYALTLKGTSLL
jgi:hypothetical protein